ncbi:hypothetical protein ALI144C_01840 [Actinosynnema sp. ALI-1.44]|uniref:hypothetical protein n=1 Tax=Actinosynnema sp. ALI-1.44 TaxID=1933779 RepID=UPI0009C509AF|nr:hypothetical protein [Actinosynnema sp. ALI-1.44]ONI90993.1 hypothetical protein ALI144C_01840 [Actinosynnema sp. ALI-1.44]
MAPTRLPLEGDEFTIRCDAAEAEMSLRAKPLNVRFTGECTVRVAKADQTDTRVDLELVAFQLTADLPDAGGAEDGGSVHVRLDDAEATSSGRVEQVSATSAGFDMHLVVGLCAEVQQPGGTVELVSEKPMRLSARLDHFPPQDGRCELEAPVDLVVPDTPEATVVQLQNLPLTLQTP